MPSLRRTISSPSVRSSPYRALSSAVSGGPTQRSKPHGYRPSSGSDSSTRRVLADIEWWRIVAGQRDFDADLVPEDRNRDQTLDHFIGRALAAEEPSGSTAMTRTEAPPSTADEGALHEISMPPATAFATLSITPHSPGRRPYSRQSSVSSLYSTSEAIGPTSFDGLRFTIPSEELGFPGPLLPDFPIFGCEGSCEREISPLFPLHTHSFNDFVTIQTRTGSQFADFAVSPLSAAPFLCD